MAAMINGPWDGSDFCAGGGVANWTGLPMPVSPRTQAHKMGEPAAFYVWDGEAWRFWCWIERGAVTRENLAAWMYGRVLA